MKCVRTLYLVFAVMLCTGLLAPVGQGQGQDGETQKDRTTDEESSEDELPLIMPFWLRCLGWVVLGLFGAGAIGARLRGKPTGLVILVIFAFTGYRTYAAWQADISVIPPLLCFAVAIALGGMAKTAGDSYLEDDEEGWSRLKRRDDS